MDRGGGGHLGRDASGRAVVSACPPAGTSVCSEGHMYTCASPAMTDRHTQPHTKEDESPFSSQTYSS